MDELIAKGLTAAQTADVARRSLAILEAAPEMTSAAAEPPMRALVEELGLSLWHFANGCNRAEGQPAVI